MLQVEEVTKKYRGGRYGVRALSLAARPGVLGLLGPNGAGKTTLMQMIATVTRPTGGRILVDGVDVTKDPQAVRRRLGYLPQDFGVYDNLTAFELLDYVARLKGVRSRARVLEMLELVNLHAVAGRPVGGFSGGMRQRLGIAKGSPPFLDYGGWWGTATPATAAAWLAGAVAAGAMAAVATRVRVARES